MLGFGALEIIIWNLFRNYVEMYKLQKVLLVYSILNVAKYYSMVFKV